MQTTIGGALSRLVSRSLVTGVVSNKETTQTADSTRLVTAVSGFPKQKTGYNIDNILKGQIGEDAYFIARHVDDWNSEFITAPGDKSADNARARNPAAAATTPNSNAGVASVRSAAYSNADVIGVADGVGGWRQYGVDPGQFSSQLMRNCERLVKAGYVVANQPQKLLAQGFREMKEAKKQVIQKWEEKARK